MNDTIKHHMSIPWHEFTKNEKLAYQASLQTKTSLIGRVGIMMLSCGTGAWRVRESMNAMARVLDVQCSADIGLVSIEFTCYQNGQSCTQALSLPSTGINTIELHELESFVASFKEEGRYLTDQQINNMLDRIERASNNYSSITVSLAAGMACSAFVFLLGGGLVEMLCCLIAASLGCFVRKKMNEHHLTVLAGVAVSVTVACVSYSLILSALRLCFDISATHEAGYIGAMLFVIPGFPFITSGLDISKLDMRSGLERLAYSIMIVMVATLIGWLVALIMHLKPEALLSQHLTSIELLLLRLPMSFIGVFGFSMMFNSTPKMATTAGIVGAIANTLRLELANLTTILAGVDALIGAFVAGILASIVQSKSGYPRISITVPSMVVMVPGLYMYRAVYEIGNLSLHNGMNWFVKAGLIMVFLQLGLITARLLTDKRWRYTN